MQNNLNSVHDCQIVLILAAATEQWRRCRHDTTSNSANVTCSAEKAVVVHTEGGNLSNCNVIQPAGTNPDRSSLLNNTRRVVNAAFNAYCSTTKKPKHKHPIRAQSAQQLDKVINHHRVPFHYVSTTNRSHTNSLIPHGLLLTTHALPCASSHSFINLLTSMG